MTTKIGQIRAELFREDLLDAGIGTGNHAFEFKFDPALSARIKHVINVRNLHGSDILGSPAILTAEPPPEAPGNIDRADRYMVAGWCQVVCAPIFPSALPR